MANKNRQRQLQNRHARIAAAAAARERARRRRVLLWVGSGVAVLLVVLIVILVAASGDDDGEGDVAAGDTDTTTTAAPVDADGDGVPDETTSTSAAAGSAAGLPCVELADPLPDGAPSVPIQVGAPPTELIVEDLEEGDGAEVQATDTLTVNYIGVSCSTGKIFDESYSRGQPATFPLNQVIPGWTQGLPGMKVGGTRLLGIPPAAGYGAAGSPPDIAPDETLWFVVEVLSNQPAATG